MVDQVSLRPEALSTALLRADEGPLVTVNPHVDLQVLLLTEPLWTPWKGASVWLSAKVQVHVGRQSYFSAENFRTARVRAWEDTSVLVIGGGLPLRAAVLLMVCTLATPFHHYFLFVSQNLSVRALSYEVHSIIICQFIWGVRLWFLLRALIFCTFFILCSARRLH